MVCKPSDVISLKLSGLICHFVKFLQSALTFIQNVDLLL